MCFGGVGRFTENLKKHEAPGVKRKSRRREQEEKTRRIDEECILRFFSGSGMIEGTFYLFLFIFAVYIISCPFLSLCLYFSLFPLSLRNVGLLAPIGSSLFLGAICWGTSPMFLTTWLLK